MSNLENIEKQLVDCEQVLAKIKEILCHHNPENTKLNFSETVFKLKTDLEDQLRKIRKKDFEISVVGREKAGKSSLLNAWIGFNLLPNERNRCTYTTTEIRSCVGLENQKYQIDYFTSKEFNEKLNQIKNTETGIRSLDNLKNEELNDIENFRSEIQNYLDKDSEVKNFKSFDQVKDYLKSAISKPGHARAVKNICIWTPKLSESENVVLYDVPGYDSPIQLHKEQTKQKIASSDAVLYAKQFCSPDLVDCEIEILKIADSNNPFIKAKDKIIVALTNCDLANSPREFGELVLKNNKSWMVNGIVEDRIVPVCSLAELKENTPEKSKSLKSLQELNGGDSGFSQLRKAVQECIVNSRVKISSDRCNDIKNKIQDLFKTLSVTVKDKFDFNSDENLTLGNDEMDKIYSEWWTNQWRNIHEEFQTFFMTTIRPKLSADESSHINEDDVEFKNLYETMIDEIFQSIPTSKRERQLMIYNSVMAGGIVSPKEGNTKIRTELSYHAIEILDKLTSKLNLFLWQNIDKMIAWMRKRLWNLPEIREEVISSDEELESRLMQRSFDSLIQRLAIPATHIFLRFPRSKIERLRVMNEYQIELLVLDKFIIDGRLVDRGIVSFLANGNLERFEFNFKQDNAVVYGTQEVEKKEESTVDIYASNMSLDSIKGNRRHGLIDKIRGRTDKKEEEKNKESKNIKEIKETKDINDTESDFKVVVKGKISKTSQFDDLKFSADSANFDQINKEIDMDMSEFIDCMKNSVFYGSGIQRFYNQQLDKIRRKFLDLENTKRRWHYYVFKHLKNKDASSKISIPAPNMDEEIKNRLNIMKNMKEINQIVSNFNF